MDIRERVAKLQTMVDTLLGDSAGFLPKPPEPVDLSHREKFYKAIDSTWLYYYLPLGHIFERRAPNLTRPSWEKGSPLTVAEVEGGVEFALATEGTRQPEVATPECITLADIFSELWFLASKAVPGKRLKLAAFMEDVGGGRDGDVVVDVLCASYFTAKCKPVPTKYSDNDVRRFDLIDINSRNSFGCQPPDIEFRNRNFAFTLDDKEKKDDREKKLVSLACFPAFYSDHRCSGTVLTSRKDTAWVNGEDFETYQKHLAGAGAEVLDARDHGIIPVVTSLLESGTFGYDYKLLVMFGTKTDVPGDGESDSVASTAFFSIGLKCDEATACAIAKAIYLSINTLQNELFAATSRYALRQLHEAHEELQRQQQVINTVLPEIVKINESIAMLQTQVQYVNSHLAPGQSGLFSAYNKVAPLFNDGSKVTLSNLPSFEIVIDHNVNYGKEEANHTLLLCLALGNFLGYAPLEYLEKTKGLTLKNLASYVNIKLKDFASEVVARAKQGVPTAAAIMKLCLPQESLARFLAGGTMNWEEIYGQFNAFITSPENQRSALENIKDRYHRPLKTGRRTSMSLATLIPYLEIRLAIKKGETATELSTELWESWVFSSHAPLLQFLEHFLLTESARSKALCWYEIEHKTIEGFRVSTLTIKNENDKKPPALFAEKKWWEGAGARDGINRELEYLKAGGVGNSMTGYSTGDTIIPFQRLLHLVPRDHLKPVTVTTKQDEGGVVLSFDEVSDTQALILEVMENHIVIKSKIKGNNPKW